MATIQKLQEDVILKIAAGEVVERPVSVVKELCENALDAGAAHITVRIEGGGRTLIEVTDDGKGMDKEDLMLSVVRHATSKIRTADDLTTVGTLGFRGEALASIAAVSRFSLSSKQKDSTGHTLTFDGDAVSVTADESLLDGTKVTVRDLFYNTPVRMKFLKKDTTETAAVQDLLTRLALSRPDVSFELYTGPKKALNTPGRGGLLNTIGSIYGAATMKAVKPVKIEGSGMRVTGFIGGPELTRSNRRYQTFFVNGRYVTNPLLFQAVENAFRSIAMVGKHPFAVLEVTLLRENVDVNFHPTKTLVRFADEQAVFGLIMHGVRNALRSEMAVVDLKLTDDEPIYKPRLKVTVTPPAFNFKPKNGDVFVWEGKKEEPKKPAPAPEKPAEKPIKAEVDPFIPEEKPSPKKAMSFYDVVRQGAGKPAAGKAAEPETEYRDKAPVKQEEKTPEPQEQMTLIREEIPADKPKTPALQLSVMGILDDVYIVSTDGRDLYIVDQHAAHERILYNKWKQEAEKKMVVLQALLEPIRMELSPLEAAFIRENAGTFERVGFLPEFMGGNTVILREVPLLFGKNRGDSAFKTLLSGLMDRSKMTSVSAVSEDVIMRLACRVAVKAGDRMDTPTAERLIKDLLLTEDYLTCPHGRPTMLKMSRQELTKYFKRI